MSYAMSASLQKAIYQHLIADTTLTGLVGTDIYDALPSGDPPGRYISLGPEEVLDLSDSSGAGAEHRVIISVVTSASGFQEAKEIAAAIDDALDNIDETLDRGRLVNIQFEKAIAERIADGDTRRIDLTFRARVEE